MRGDSVRDLYAKVLALMGLAALAGTGALVDYWPVQGNLPGVSFTLSLPSHPVPLAASVALSSAVALPSVSYQVTAPVVVAAPIAVEADLPVVTVPTEAALAGPATQRADVEPSAEPGADPAQLVASDAGLSVPIEVEPLAPSTLSHSSAQENATPTGNVLQRAGGHILNAGFAVGTGVAKAIGGFGTALSNIGKLFR